MVCNPNRGGEPQKIGVIIMSSPARCAACDEFETCEKPQAFLARVALAAALSAAMKDAEERQARLN